MSMKNSNDTIWNRSRDLSVCSAVPQPLRHRVPLPPYVNGLQSYLKNETMCGRKLTNRACITDVVGGRTSYLLNIRQWHPMYWLSGRERHRKCIHVAFAVIWSNRQEEPPTACHIRDNNDRSIINVPVPSTSAHFKTFQKN
jgi:hypothetical protein